MPNSITGVKVSDTTVAGHCTIASIIKYQQLYCPYSFINKRPYTNAEVFIRHKYAQWHLYISP